MRHLRIFYAADTTPNAWFKSVRSNIWRNNLLLPLRDLGHEVLEFDFDLTETFRKIDPALHADFITQNRPKITTALLHQLKEAHQQKPLDLLFTYFTDACIEPTALDEIRQLGIRTANWFCNASYQLHLVEKVSPQYDFILVPEKFRLEDYRRLGAHPIYCQEAANPNIYKPLNIPQDLEVSFAGQAYGDRPDYVKFLLDAQIPIHAFGFNWRPPPHRTAELAAVSMIPESHRHDVLPDDELIRLYSRSKINLGFSTCGETHKDGSQGGRIVQIRLRDFEIPMAGGFYLVERIAELAEFFHLGTEIETYTSPEELRDKIRYYLTHDAARENIRSAGHNRARRDHTWHQRFQTAFTQMGLT